MSTVSPFAAGQLAYTAGRKAIGNPHPLHSKDWVRWNSGWTSAQLAAQKAKRAADLEAIDARELPQWAELEAGK